MRLLVVDAPGVLYPIDQEPPNADPITSALRLVRALTEGFGVSVLVVGQLSAQDHEAQLRAWLKTYDVTFTWLLSSDSLDDPLTFWDNEVGKFIGSSRSTPVALLTSRTDVAHRLASKGLPALRFYAPSGLAPDWGPAVSTWATKGPPAEE